MVVEALREMEFHVEERDSGYKSDFDFRVNSVELFWSLVGYGYRLGENVVGGNAGD